VRLVDQALRFGEWVGLSWVFPSIGIDYSGTARLCTSDHVPIFPVGLVADQGVPKMLAGRWTECSEQVPELRFSVECLGHATTDS
jgi:hypothetical protein